MRILRNEVFHAEDHPLLGDSRFRILEIKPEFESLILFELELLPRAKKPFVADLEAIHDWESSEWIQFADYEAPRIMTLDDDQIPEDMRTKRDSRLKSIQQLINDPDFLWQFASNRRCDLVAAEARRQSALAMEIYRILWRFWEYGQTPNALLDNTANCGAPGKDRIPGSRLLGAPLREGKFVKRSRRKVNVDDDDKAIFVEALRQVVLKVRANSIKFSYENVYLEVKSFSPYRDEIELADSESRAAQIPTMRQFRRALDKVIDRVDIDRAILPRHVWLKDYRGITSSAKVLACVPGSRYEIDATIADVYIVSEFDRNLVLGRPTIYVVVCVSSRMIVGFHVSLKWASWDCARQALYNAFTDKVAYCRRYGIDIEKEEWPCEGVPTRIFADRGEMVGEQPKVLTKMLGSNIEIAPPLRSDAKGIVERQFGIANEQLHITPGTTLGQLKERGYPDYRDKAVLTLHELTTTLCSKFHLNNTQTLYDELLTEEMVAANVAHTPANFWNHHVAKGQHSLKYFAKDKIIAGLLPETHASIHRDGIVANDIRFTCDRAEEERWYSRARHSGRRQLEARGDLGWTSDLYVRVAGENDFLKCQLIDTEKLRRNRHPDDIEFLNEWTREKEEAASRDNAALKHKDRTESIVENAKKEKANTPTDKSASQLRKGINDRRKLALVDPVKKDNKPSTPPQRSSRAVKRALRLVDCSKEPPGGNTH